jgi:glucokinase
VTNSVVLGIDVGGTSIKARTVDAAGQLLHEWRRPTPTGDVTGTSTAAIAAELVAQARELGRVDAVGIVVPGIVDEVTGHCINAVNLSWNDLPIRQILESKLGTAIAFDQDVRAGALAEVTTGAAAGVRGIVAFVPIGTGIASAIANDGRVLPSREWSGEIGQVVLSSGRHAGRRVEEIASASAIARSVRVKNAKEAAQLVEAGDALARTVWDDAIEVVADMLAWIVATVAPEVIVVGGGLAEAGSLLFEPLAARLSERVPEGRRPRLAAAFHGEAAARQGACQLALELLANRGGL